jgi:hypothetical protein
MNNKSILEQALLQVQTLEEAVKANAKGILASTMKQELNDLLKESMEEEMPVEDEVSDMEMNEQPGSDEEAQDDVPAETGDEEDLDNEITEPSDDEEVSKNIDDLDSDMEDMDDMGSMEDDEDVVDMTDADDEEILKVFKAMSDEDGIIVKKDGSDIELSDGDDEYIIKLDEEMEESDVEPVSDMEEEASEEEAYEEDETVYEIELDEEEGEEEVSEMELVYELEDETEVEEGEESPEGDVDEAARTKWNIHGDKGGADRAGIKSKKTLAAGAINEEIETLKKQNDEYKKALVLFKDKLNEVAVFNANLAYATRLFTEHSTTKQEKLNILKRFDAISTLSESKNLYKTLKTELETKQPISESVVEKITSAPSTSSSGVLSESKAYENPQFKRMKDLMSKIK